MMEREELSESEMYEGLFIMRIMFCIDMACLHEVGGVGGCGLKVFL
jgi:hypothetical protein